MAFASVPELRAFLRRSPEDLDAELAQLFLDLASQAVRDETGQLIELVEDDFHTFGPGPDGREYLTLPQVPVKVVSAVVERGQLLEPGVQYTWSLSGLLERHHGAWPAEAGAVVVTYTHGLTPEEVKRSPAWSVTLQAAARCALNPEQVTQLALGDYSRSWSPAADGRTGRIELSAFERGQLARLKP